MLYLILGILTLLFTGLTILFFVLHNKYYYNITFFILALICLGITIILIIMLFSFSMMLLETNKNLVAIETKLDIPNTALEGIIQEVEEIDIVDYYASIKVYGRLSIYWPLRDRIMNIYNKVLG